MEIALSIVIARSVSDEAISPIFKGIAHESYESPRQMKRVNRESSRIYSELFAFIRVIRGSKTVFSKEALRAE